MIFPVDLSVFASVGVVLIVIESALSRLEGHWSIEVEHIVDVRAREVGCVPCATGKRLEHAWSIRVGELCVHLYD